MAAKEIIRIVRESELWALLTEKEEHELIKYDLKSAQLSIADVDIVATVGEVYLELK